MSPARLQRRILSKASLQPSIEPYVLSFGVPSNLTDLQTEQEEEAKGGKGGKGRRKGRGEVDRMVEGRWERGGDR